MMRFIALALAVLAAIAVNAGISAAENDKHDKNAVTFGWEDARSTTLGSYNKLRATNVAAPEPVHGGLHALKLIDDAERGTPQAFLAWVTGLQAGDRVEASFWVYDTTPGKPGPPSARIWAHYNDNPKDAKASNGSAGGNKKYPPGTGWSRLKHAWTIKAPHEGLMIEARTYSKPGDTVWIDDLRVVAPPHASIYMPYGDTPEKDGDMPKKAKK